MGLLAGKTRILATHAIHYLKYCDYIYVMKEGAIVGQGTYEEMKEDSYFSTFVNIVKERTHHHDHDIKAKEPELPGLVKEKSSVQKESSKQKEEGEDEINAQDLGISQKEAAILNSLLQEDREYGTVTWRVYLKYVKFAGGIVFVFFLSISVALWSSLYLLSQWLLSRWSIAPISDFWYWYKLFIGVSFGYTTFAFIRVVILYRANIRAGRLIHTLMIRKLTHAQIAGFWDRIPIGRCMTKLTKDLDTIDKQIPGTLVSMLYEVVLVIIEVTIACWGTSLILILFILFFSVFAIFLQKYQIKVYRESTRLENVSGAPITSYFLETLNGLTVIRSYGKLDFVYQKYESFLTKNMQNLVVKYGIQNFYYLYQNILTSVIQTPAIFMLFYYSGSTSLGVIGLTIYIVIDLVLTLFPLIYSDGRNSLGSSITFCLPIPPWSPK